LTTAKHRFQKVGDQTAPVSSMDRLFGTDPNHVHERRGFNWPYLSRHALNVPRIPSANAGTTDRIELGSATGENSTFQTQRMVWQTELLSVNGPFLESLPT